MTTGWKRLMVMGSALCVATFVALNILAWRQARAMLFYRPEGVRTAPPETLSPFAKIRVLLAGVHLVRPKEELAHSALSPEATIHTIHAPGGITLSAWLAGAAPEAPLVVLFHGYSTGKTGMLTEARMLRDLGAGVALVDFRGSGGSSESYTTLGVSEAEDVVAVVDYVREHAPHSALILYGQSMGAAAILRAIHVHGLEPDAVMLESVFDTMRNAVRNRFAAMGVPSFPSADLLLFWGGRQLGFSAFAHRPVDYASSLNSPALFLHGGADPRATAAQARRVFDAAPGPKDIVLFTEAGHVSLAARDPEMWRAAVDAFLSAFRAPAPDWEN